MIKKYFLKLLFLFFIGGGIINAQTTVNYTQQVANYNTTFTDNGGNFDNGATEFGMWANGGGAKQSVAWRTFSVDGTTSGTATTMEVGDSFTITISHTRAWGQIGIALLESPAATASWADRLSNYAVQVNLNGNGGVFDPWEVVPSAGTTVASAINGNDNATGYKDAIIKFTRSSSTQITVDINGGAFSTTVTPTSVTGITGYSVYINDDWNGDANSNIYWKQTAEYKYENKTTWNGSTDTNWNDGTNWSSGLPPSSSKNVVIPSAPANQPSINTVTATTKDLTIDSGATLAILGSDSYLTVSGNLVNNGTFNMNTVSGGGSLMISGTSSGNINFNIPTLDTNWHLVSSPVTGETIDDAWVAANSLSTGTGANRGAAGYDNSTDANGSWSYFQAGNSFPLASGEGFSLQRTSAGNYTLIGTYTTAPVSFTAQQSSGGFGGGVGNDWNLVGNPFAAYIDIAAFITANTANFSGPYQAVYVWDNTANGGTGAYVPKTTGYLQPGQGFFINADAGTSITYTSAMQSHQTGVTFYRTSSTDFSINLSISNGTSTKSTEISYLANKTTGLDPRFDIGFFTGQDSSFDIYTHLASNSNGVAFMKQALPDSNYENMVIPIGVNATSGTEITFTANVANLPTGIDVYLEDRTANTFTKLNDNGNYTLTLNTDSNGIGQFYLRTSSSALGLDSAVLENVSIYKTNNTTLRIVGLQQGKASLKIANVLGKQLFNKTFTTNGVSNVSLPTLATGIYIVQLQTENGKMNKKIIIE